MLNGYENNCKTVIDQLISFLASTLCLAYKTSKQSTNWKWASHFQKVKIQSVPAFLPSLISDLLCSPWVSRAVTLHRSITLLFSALLYLPPFTPDLKLGSYFSLGFAWSESCCQVPMSMSFCFQCALNVIAIFLHFTLQKLPVHPRFALFLGKIMMYFLLIGIVKWFAYRIQERDFDWCLTNVLDTKDPF